MGRLQSHELDGLMAGARTRRDGLADTQPLHFRRCDVCGLPVFWNEHEEPPGICPHCDVKLTATMVDLLMKGHRLPKSRVDG